VSERSRLLIAEHPATCAGIRMVLEADVEVCAVASDSAQAIRAAMREQPDVCLVGWDIPGGGLHAVRGICRSAPEAAVIVLAEVRDVEDMLACVRAGAIGYVPGTLDGEHLRRIIRAVDANEAVLPRSMVLEVLLELRGSGGDGELLTPRETQVLRLLRRGYSTAAIARRLEIAPVTVRRHVSELVHKLGVEHRAVLTQTGSRWFSQPPGTNGVACAPTER
jgi:DNA-binding NarL/FixJ family response regulator